MIFTVCYAIGAGAFLALIALMLLNRAPKGFGLSVLLTCVITLAWAVAAAVQPWWMPGVAHALESLRSCAWLVLIAFVLSSARSSESAPVRWFWLPLAAATIGLASVVNDCRLLVSSTSALAFTPSQMLVRIAVAVCGILMVENLYRNASPGRRWHVIPMCVAVGALFAYDLFVFCEAVVLHRLDPPLLAGRGLVLALIVPLLVLTMARNPGWNIDIHVSRRVVFHGATLSATGVFLLLAASVGGLIGRIPGQWARASEFAFFCGSIILLLVVLSTESFRSRLRRLIAENFYSTRYDYRAEWLRTIATLSSGDAGEPLTLRAIRAVADVVDSPGGALWLEDAAGGYKVSQLLAMPLDLDAVEPAGSDFIAGFRGGETVQHLFDDRAPRPSWAERAWIAVPLTRIDRLMGFVVLSPPRAPGLLNWESSDLLLAIGQQVASYLEEERATRTLLESQALIDYSRRFAFVIHDIKNVSGQLSLMLSNVQKFGERAEFRADMIRGMEGAAKKLRYLVERLRPDATPMDGAELVDPAEAITDLVRERTGTDTPLRAEITSNKMLLRIVPSDFHAILTHVVNNAQEASAVGDEVIVRLRSEPGKAVIEVLDRGSGMSAEFIRNSLFVPLRSTKARGHGVGAYQARALARAAGGELEVRSAIGRGTTVRIVLPDVGTSVGQPCEAIAS